MHYHHPDLPAATFAHSPPRLRARRACRLWKASSHIASTTTALPTTITYLVFSYLAPIWNAVMIKMVFA